MTTTTASSRSWSDSGASQPSPWPPLTRLAETAARTAAQSGIVAITRGFDRRGREQATTVRGLLRDKGISAIEVTPAAPAPQLWSSTPTSGVTAVVNLVGAGSWQPYRLAANLRVPLLALDQGEQSTSTEEIAERRPAVIGLTDAEDHRDVALSRVAVQPAEDESAALVLDLDGQRRTVTGGEVSVTVREETLVVDVLESGRPEETVDVKRLSIEGSDGAFRLVRDELPIADLDGAVTLTPESQALAISLLGI